MKKKALAIVLVLCMVISMLPMTAFAAPVRKTAQIQAQPQTAITPGALPELPAEPDAGKYRITARVEKDYNHGEIELYASRADAGEIVYMMVNPDDGYLPGFNGGYSYSEHDMVITYVGMDLYEIQMPDGDVEFVIGFYPAEGSDHHLEVYENGGVGDYVLSRSWAWEGESVLLAVKPRNNEAFDPMSHVWVSGALAYYLFEEEGIHYYEIIMGFEHVNIFLCYERTGPYYVTPWLDGDPNGGTVTVSHEKAYVGDLVTVTIKTNPGFTLKRAQAVSYAGDLCFDLTPIGNDQYTFRMHPAGVELHVVFEAELRNVSVTASPGGKARVDAFRTKVGSTVTLTCTPDAGYKVDKITGVDGISALGGNVYQFTMPARDVEIHVTFKSIYNPVTVTVETGLGGSAITNVAEAKAGDIVTVVCTPDEGYRVARIAGVKELTDNGDGTYTFTMPDEAVNLQVLFLRHENPFLDVNETHYFYESVLWAVENGITDGVSDTAFDPGAVCIRAQVVTFLWRYAGSPEPTTTDNPFTDVPAESWFTKAVLWAVENGITTGVSDTEFGPGLTCSRAQVVTFLWRFMGQPESTLTGHSFVDVESESWYEMPVLWALENGITTGTDATHFAPGGLCIRAQVVTFLYRTAQLPVYYGITCDFDAAHGSVTLSQDKALAGETVTATVIPAEGYLIESVACTGAEVTQLSDSEFTFVMPEEDVVLEVIFSEIPVEPTEPEPTEPEPTEPEPTDPVQTFELDLRDNGNGRVAYVDNQTAAAPGESIFFYAVPNEGYYLDHVGIFNPNGTIDVSSIQIHEHGDGLYELIMIPHDLIMTCYFYPIG